MEVICQGDGERKGLVSPVGDLSLRKPDRVLEKGVKTKEDEAELAMWHPGHK